MVEKVTFLNLDCGIRVEPLLFRTLFCNVSIQSGASFIIARKYLFFFVCTLFIFHYTPVPRIQRLCLQALSSLVENINQTFQNFHKAIDTNRFQAIRNSEQVFRHRQELMRAIPHEPVTSLPTPHRIPVRYSFTTPNSPRSPSARSSTSGTR